VTQLFDLKYAQNCVRRSALGALQGLALLLLGLLAAHGARAQKITIEKYPPKKNS